MSTDTSSVAQRTLTEGRRPSVTREFLVEQTPIILSVLALGYAAAYLQHGFLPGADRAFPLAQVRVPIWHLVWMGVWTGYTMAIVGQAAGIFALPYNTSVLQFSNPHVTPTMLVLTIINPVGALLGFRRTGQWNLDLAVWVSIGGAVGGLLGPFLRSTVLASAGPFQFTLGIFLAIFGVQLFWSAVFGSRTPARTVNDTTCASHEPFRIKTVSRSGRLLTISYQNEKCTLSKTTLFVIGSLVGVISAALGVGGGFLLVPIFAIMYKLPMYVMVAGTIPYSIVLSLAGILSYDVILPTMGTPAIQPEWAWGLFAAAGGVFGAWVAAKTQLFVPEHFLKIMLGGVTGLVGVIYIVNFFFVLPFHV